MGYRSLKACVDDLAATGRLIAIDEEIDPNLEAAAIQRRVYAAGGPALYFPRVKGSPFPMVSNLFGTMDRARFIFRDTWDAVRRLIDLKIDPQEAFKHPLQTARALPAAFSMLPRKVKSGPILARQTQIDQLPQLKSWPDDGGAFITLPQVYTEDADRPGLAASNLGMYRVQLSGGQYVPNREVGLHYQIHRGIGVHHAAAIRRGVPFRVNIFVGGPPAMSLAAVMPLPEGLSELGFAGALAGHRVAMICRPGELPLHADTDFCMSGVVDPERLLPEGPFGDHLGYYSLAHDFPVLRVDRVYHREGAIWPFTVVGRPPQEDTVFGQMIHELTGPVIPTVLPGIRAVHAVDASGVHPLLLAIGSERYVPFAERRRPAELLTQANAILGQGQMSLAKYLLIVAHDECPQLDIHDIRAFFRHVLERVDWRRDLHFHTATTIDTLDYSGSGLNEGSKVVIAAVGAKSRDLPVDVPADLWLPEPFRKPRVCLPGVLAVEGPQYQTDHDGVDQASEMFCAACTPADAINQFPLVVVVDDSDFTAQTLNNFLWVTFTRSNPASDIHGIDASTRAKHWSCNGSLVIDARIKPHHAPPLIEDPDVIRRVEALGAPGRPLHGII
ncbi:MAG: UbiD family decarboxylase [Pirellulales bacterium]|nr:UbiD family decarboxylase [Pirellulales bacterium]